MTDEPIRKREDVDIENKATSLPEAEITRMTDDIVAALKTVYDPEIPADIYELGLIYKVDIEDDRSVKVDMTLTTPNCPSAAELPHDGGERGRERAGREQRQVQRGLGSAVGPEPDVGRGAARAQHVVSCATARATPYIDVSEVLGIFELL